MKTSSGKLHTEWRTDVEYEEAQWYKPIPIAIELQMDEDIFDDLEVGEACNHLFRQSLAV